MSRIGRPPQTHCKRGHSLDDAYIFTRKKTGKRYRVCRQCSIDNAKAYNREHYVPHPKPIAEMSDDPAVVAYTAGLFDGEGTVGIRSNRKPGGPKRYHSLVVSITSTEPALTEWLQTYFGGAVRPNHRENAERNYKDAWKWTLHSRHAAAFLEAVLPHLIAKRPQALVGLKLREIQDERLHSERLTPEVIAQREALKQEMHRLNRRGREPIGDV